MVEYFKKWEKKPIWFLNYLSGKGKVGRIIMIYSMISDSRPNNNDSKEHLEKFKNYVIFK